MPSGGMCLVGVFEGTAGASGGVKEVEFVIDGRLVRSKFQSVQLFVHLLGDFLTCWFSIVGGSR